LFNLKSKSQKVPKRVIEEKEEKKKRGTLKIHYRQSIVQWKSLNGDSQFNREYFVGDARRNLIRQVDLVGEAPFNWYRNAKIARPP